jgi:hypothetical protein
VYCRGIPHLAKNERDAPNFLCADLDKTACAPFFKERRMRFVEPTKPHRKSGMWGTQDSSRREIPGSRLGAYRKLGAVDVGAGLAGGANHVEQLQALRMTLDGVGNGISIQRHHQRY